MLSVGFRSDIQSAFMVDKIVSRKKKRTLRGNLFDQSSDGIAFVLGGGCVSSVCRQTERK